MSKADQIKKKMLQEAKTYYGRESEAHQAADDLLIEAIKMLAEQCGKEVWALEFIGFYDNIGKWYE